MMGSRSKRRAGTRRRIRVPHCALVFSLLIGAASAYADDVSGESADDAPEAYLDDAVEADVDDVSNESADDAVEADVDDAAEDVDEDSRPSFGRAAWDVHILRPMNFIRLVVGCALIVPVSVLALPGGNNNVLDMVDHFVGQPYWDTFERPLGKF